MVRAYRRVGRLEDETELARRTHREPRLSIYYDDNGCLVLNGRLDPEQGQAFCKALETSRDAIRESAKNVSAETSEETMPDSPFAAQRADALLLMAESFMAHGAAGRNGAERTQVVVQVDESVLNDASSPGRCECEHGPALAVETAKRMSCDTTLVRVMEDGEGSVLSVGRKTHTVPPTLRRALQIRDQGCVIPDCGNRYGIDAHHIVHWANGGETGMNNLISLCKFHHRLVHEEGFGISTRRQ